MERNNKALYEKIMRNVSKQVKRALNEEYCALYPDKTALYDLLEDIRMFKSDTEILNEIFSIMSYDALVQVFKDLSLNWDLDYFNIDPEEDEPESVDYGPLG